MAWQMYGSFAKFLRLFPFSARATYAACCAFVCLFLMRIFLSCLAQLSHFRLVRMQIRSRVMHCVTRHPGPADAIFLLIIFIPYLYIIDDVLIIISCLILDSQIISDFVNFYLIIYNLLDIYFFFFFNCL